MADDENKELRNTVPIGQITQEGLIGQVLVQGDNVVLRFIKGPQGYSITFSVTAMEKFNDIVATAVRVARGQGRH